MRNEELLFEEVVEQLGLKVKDTESDKEQLQKILFQILEYPNLKETQRHHRASKIGVNDLLSNQTELQRQLKEKEIEDFDVCKCCGLMVNDEELPYCTNLKDIKMGVGVHLFFHNYLFNIGIFTLMFLCFSIYAMVTNYQAGGMVDDVERQYLCLHDNSGDQSSIPCQISLLGAGSKIIFQTQEKNRMSEIQCEIGLAFVVAWGFILMMKTYLDEKLVAKIKNKKITACDFTLMIQNMPKRYIDKPYEEAFIQLQQMFIEYGKKFQSQYSYQIIKFNVAKPLYQDEQGRKEFKFRERRELHKKTHPFREMIKQRQVSVQFSTPQQERVRLYEDYEDFYKKRQEFKIGEHVTLQDQNLVFITLRSSKAREEIEKRNRYPTWRNLWNTFYKGDFPIPNLKICMAPEPQEIIWRNVGFSRKKKYLRRVGLTLVTILLVGASLGISLGVAKVNGDEVSQVVAILISIVITIANMVIKVIIMLLSRVEHQKISSFEQTSIAVKIGFGQLLNSIGVPIAVTVIVNNSEFFEDRSWMTAGGLVDNVFYISFFNVFVPFSRLIDPRQIFLKIRRKWAEHPSVRLNIHGQRQMNRFYGNNEFKIGYQYSYLIKTSIYTSFFVTLQPLVAAFAPVGLLLFYLIERRNILRHFKRPKYDSPEINKNVDVILLLSLVAFGFGSYAVNNRIQELKNGSDADNGTLALNLAIILTGAVFVILIPFKIFYHCLNHPQSQEILYEQKRALLDTDFDRVNPVTKDQSLEHFLLYLAELEQKEELPPDCKFLKLRETKARMSETQNRHIKFRKLESMKKMDQTSFRFQAMKMKKFSS